MGVRRLVSVLELGSDAIVPALVVLVVGFLVGVIIKRTVKLGLAILSLVGVLAALGYINFQLGTSSPETIYRVFSYAKPLASQATSIAALLPVTSAAFLAGLALGVWKG